MARDVMRSLTLLATFVLLGCPGGTTGGSGGGSATGGSDPNVPRGITAEQLEEIERVKRIGNSALIDCYTEELERRDTKKLEGVVTVKILIAPSGKAEDVQISRSTLNAPLVHQCIQQVIRSWDFPQLSAPTWYGSTFSFTPAY